MALADPTLVQGAAERDQFGDFMRDLCDRAVGGCGGGHPESNAGVRTCRSLNFGSLRSPPSTRPRGLAGTSRAARAARHSSCASQAFGGLGLILSQGLPSWRAPATPSSLMGFIRAQRLGWRRAALFRAGPDWMASLALAMTRRRLVWGSLRSLVEAHKARFGRRFGHQDGFA